MNIIKVIQIYYLQGIGKVFKKWSQKVCLLGFAITTAVWIFYCHKIAWAYSVNPVFVCDPVSLCVSSAIVCVWFITSACMVGFQNFYTLLLEICKSYVPRSKSQ